MQGIPRGQSLYRNELVVKYQAKVSSSQEALDLVQDEMLQSSLTVVGWRQVY